VFDVARAATGGESYFFGMMRGSVVALQAGIVADLLMEKSQRAGMAEVTVLAQDGVRRGELAAAENFLAVGTRGN
jgi:hypothetical protein